MIPMRVCAYKLYAGVSVRCHLFVVRALCFSCSIGRMIALVRMKAGDTTTRTDIETAGSGKIWVSGFGPWEPAAAKQHLTF